MFGIWGGSWAVASRCALPTARKSGMLPRMHRHLLRSPALRLVAIATLGLGTLVGCGAATPREDLLPRLQAAIDAPVSSTDQSHEHSRLVEEVVRTDALMGKTRQEVMRAIGKGEECSLHPRCDEHGFDDSDWFYQVGQLGGAQPPYLIVGFDREGRVGRTWYLKTH